MRSARQAILVAVAGLSASLASGESIFHETLERGDPCAWSAAVGFSGPATFNLDFDSDQYGDDGESIQSPGCAPPPGYAFEGGDCDDLDAAVNPGAAEICGNDIDDNCDSLVDEEDPVCPVPMTVFVTSLPVNGNLGGLSGADATCGTVAATADLPGEFVAFLSDFNNDAADRITADGPWHLAGTFPLGKVADNKADLLDGSIDTPINVGESGQSIPGVIVWTGSGADGTYSGQACSNWTDGTAASISNVGANVFSDSQWANWAQGACNTVGVRLYCFQVGP